MEKTFYPSSSNRMNNVGNLSEARRIFLKERPTNLCFLLKSRYDWMNEYIADCSELYELGCGAGFSREFIHNKSLTLTDVSIEYWVDKQVDALNLPFPDNSVDAFICSHMLHHLAKPVEFLRQAHNKLKPGGLILISDLNTSFAMKFLLKLMNHEGWSYEVDVFNELEIVNDPKDPWSANCAIPELLFRNRTVFEDKIPEYRIIRNEYTEFAIFPLSGGVIAKSPTINMPWIVLKAINKLDNLLIRLSPNIFALGRRVVLQKISTS